MQWYWNFQQSFEKVFSELQLRVLMETGTLFPTILTPARIGHNQHVIT